MNQRSLCVGIVTRNRAASLTKAITSALSQRFSNFEVAVFDDGSTDETTRLSELFPNVRWIRSNVNNGCIPVRNELMAQSSCDYFVSLDDDAWFLGNDEITQAVDFLEHNRSAAAVAFDILSPDHPNPKERGAPQLTANFIGCGHVLRMSAVREVGPYEPAPGDYGGEEKDLCLRLMDAGYQIFRLPGVHVWHDKSTLGRQLPAQHRSGVCNDLVMTFRRVPAYLLPFAMAAKFFRHLRFALKHNLLGACLSGFGLFFRSLPSVWRSRKPVRAVTLKKFVALARS